MIFIRSPMMCGETPDKERTVSGLFTDKKKLKLIVLSCLAFLLAAHVYRWMNTMYSHDSLLILQTDRGWQISLGRIFNPLYVMLRGEIVAPVNVALFASCFLILSTVLVVRILRLTKPVSIVLCCGFLTTFETLVFVNGMFLLSLDLDMLALLFSVLGAWFLTERESLARYAAGVVSIAVMLGLFQSYIEVTILLVCLELLRETLEGGDAKKLFFKGLRCVGLIILGGLLYYLLLIAALKFTGISPATSSNGLVKMKTLTGPRALSLAGQAWRFTMRYLFSDSMIAHRSISRWIYRALGLFSVGTAAAILVRKRLGVRSAALTAFLLLIMPLGGNSVYVLSLGFKHSLMNYSFVFFSVLFVMLYDLIGKDGGIAGVVRRAVPLLCAVLLLNHVLFANQWYIRNDLCTQAARSFMTRLVTDMEDVVEYVVGETPVLILGRIDENPAAGADKRFDIAVDPQTGTTHHLGVSYYRTYENYFRYILGYNVRLIPLEHVAGYLEDPQIQEMPVYPARGSIQMINDVLVIRLSEDLLPEELKWNY